MIKILRNKQTRKMKFKILLAASFILFSFTVIAQKSKVQTAFYEHQHGELGAAKEAIDLAVVNPKTNTMAKAWYYRGNIYLDIYGNKDYGDLCDNCLREAYDSYMKVDEYDVKNYYKNDLILKRLTLAQLFETDAYKNFTDKDYAAALNIFEFMLEAESFDLAKDTNVIRNAFIAAKKSDNGEKALIYSKQLLNHGFLKPWIFSDRASIQKANGDTAAAVETLTEGLKHFPSDPGLVIEELNIYLGRGDYATAISKLEKALVLEPKNTSIANALGLAHEKNGDVESAEKAYKRAIEIDPEFFNANYGLGALLFNGAAELYNKAQDIPYTQKTKYDAAKKEYLAVFEKARPYLEKANEIDPKDSDTLFSLQQLYAKVGDLKKSIEMKKLREALVPE